MLFSYFGALYYCGDEHFGELTCIRVIASPDEFESIYSRATLKFNQFTKEIDKRCVKFVKPTYIHNTNQPSDDNLACSLNGAYIKTIKAFKILFKSD